MPKRTIEFARENGNRIFDGHIPVSGLWLVRRVKGNPGAIIVCYHVRSDSQPGLGSLVGLLEGRTGDKIKVQRFLPKTGNLYIQNLKLTIELAMQDIGDII